MTTPSTPRIEAIAFDLDGTLVDTAPGVTRALNGALARAGRSGFDIDIVRGWIGPGPDALIARALAAGGGAPEPDLAARLRADFDALTLADPLGGGAPFDGILGLLSLLTPRWPLVVVTNKPTPLARAVLKATGTLHRFAAVHGADRPELRKPAPRLLEIAAARLRVAPGALLMVGDSAFDLEAARAAGCPAAWARWGYVAEIDAASPRWCLAAPSELLACLHGPDPRPLRHAGERPRVQVPDPSH